MTIYEFTVNDYEGHSVSLTDYKGKVLLIVNTATQCGFTPQYQGLQALYDQYRSAGFEILDFPCNQFAGQAPGSEAEIHQFCTLKYQTTFPQFAKINVNGDQTEPLYSFLKSQKGGVLGATIKWNFTKFLVDRSGKVVHRYGSAVKPDKISGDIEALLKQPVGE
jgi:Glutathione peroxidase